MFFFKSFAAVAEFTLVSSNVAEQEKAELFPTAEGRQAQEQLSVSEPQRSSLRAVPPMHLLAHHGFRQDWKSQCWWDRTAAEHSIFLQVHPVINPHPSSATPAQEKHGCPLKIMALACQMCPQIDGQSTALPMKDPAHTKVLQLWAGWALAVDCGEEGTEFGKTSLGKPEKNVALLLSLLFGKLLGVGEESNKPK